jgi:hypothetical protein
MLGFRSKGFFRRRADACGQFELAIPGDEDDAVGLAGRLACRRIAATKSASSAQDTERLEVPVRGRADSGSMPAAAQSAERNLRQTPEEPRRV